MRVSAMFMIVICAAGALPSYASAKSGRVARHVELISMQPALLAASPDLPPPLAMSAPTSPPLPDAFRVHDLSRRYVEYRMRGELAAAALPTDASASGLAASQSIVPIPAVSSIAVPGWMRGSYASPAAVSYTPGCAPLGYRPAGFLSQTAEARRATYYGMMSAIACEHGIPTGLFDAMIIRESGYNPGAVSSKSAFGFAQLMPGTAAWLGVDRYNPMQNMRGGARYLRQQLDKFGQVHLALAAYNAGPGRVRGGMVPNIPETRAYVSNILANWTRLGSPAVSPANPFQPQVRVGRQVQLAAF